VIGESSAIESEGEAWSAMRRVSQKMEQLGHKSTAFHAQKRWDSGGARKPTSRPVLPSAPPQPTSARALSDHRHTHSLPAEVQRVQDHDGMLVTGPSTGFYEMLMAKESQRHLERSPWTYPQGPDIRHMMPPTTAPAAFPPTVASGAAADFPSHLPTMDRFLPVAGHRMGVMSHSFAENVPQPSRSYRPARSAAFVPPPELISGVGMLKPDMPYSRQDSRFTMPQDVSHTPLYQRVADHHQLNIRVPANPDGSKLRMEAGFGFGYPGQHYSDSGQYYLSPRVLEGNEGEPPNAHIVVERKPSAAVMGLAARAGFLTN